MKPTRNFNLEEFECKCDCGSDRIDMLFVMRLQDARNIAKTPFHINSGVRCVRHNEEVKGSRYSSHLTGHAVDLRATTNHKRYKVVDALRQAGFTRIGIAKKFIHVDDDKNKPEPRLWLY